MAGAKSIVDNGMKAIIFTGTNPKRLRWFKKRAEKWEKRIVVDDQDFTKIEGDWEVKLIHRKRRQAETRKAETITDMLMIR